MDVLLKLDLQEEEDETFCRSAVVAKMEQRYNKCLFLVICMI